MKKRTRAYALLQRPMFVVAFLYKDGAKEYFFEFQRKNFQMGHVWVIVCDHVPCFHTVSGSILNRFN